MLLLKHLPIHSFNENVSYVNKECTAYKVDDIRTITRVEIHGGAVPVGAFLHVVEDNKLVKPGELALNTEAFRALGLPEGARVSLVLTEKPQSLSIVRKKIRGGVLGLNEYQSIINDIKMRQYADIDVAAFLTACHSFFTPAEAVALIKAIASERNLFWDEEDIVTDSYTLGNVPGSNTDVVVTAIVAAYGLPIPKTVAFENGNGGVSGIMHMFADIDKKTVELQKLIKENRGAVVNDNILSAWRSLSVLRSVSRYLDLDDEFFAVVEMLAEKISAGVTHLVVDIPVGPNSLIKSARRAVYMRKFLESTGDLLNVRIDVVVTDGREPIGAGVGALLEARDTMQILHNKENAPKDLREKALFLAGRILEFDPKLRGGQGYNAAKEILASGRALDAFEKIVNAQGKTVSVADVGMLSRDVLAQSSGTISAIDNKIIQKIGMFAGMAQYAGAGLYLMKKNGDKVAKGDVLYRIYACDAGAFALANSFAEANCGYEISRD